MKISIALATYNGSRYIAEQLKSLASQTLLPFELVVRDDGSTDTTLEIVKDFAKIAPFPVFIHHSIERKGYADNFLKASHLCKGDWIAFCDQDDIWRPNKLKIIAENVSIRPEVIFCAHRATIIDRTATLVGELPVPAVTKVQEYLPLNHTLWWSPYGFTQVFKAFLVHQFPFESRPSGITHDCWVFWLANILGNTLFLPNHLAQYRRHDNNASSFCEPPGLPTQLFAEKDTTQYLRASEQVAKLAAFLQNVPHGPNPVVGGRLSNAASTYKKLAQALETRSKIWDMNTTKFERSRAFKTLLTGGFYITKKHGKMGPAAGIKDLTRLLLFSLQTQPSKFLKGNGF